MRKLLLAPASRVAAVRSALRRQLHGDAVKHVSDAGSVGRAFLARFADIPKGVLVASVFAACLNVMTSTGLNLAVITAFICYIEIY